MRRKSQKASAPIAEPKASSIQSQVQHLELGLSSMLMAFQTETSSLRRKLSAMEGRLSEANRRISELQSQVG